MIISGRPVACARGCGEPLVATSDGCIRSSKPAMKGDKHVILCQWRDHEKRQNWMPLAGRHRAHNSHFILTRNTRSVTARDTILYLMSLQAVRISLVHLTEEERSYLTLHDYHLHTFSITAGSKDTGFQTTFDKSWHGLVITASVICVHMKVKRTTVQVHDRVHSSRTTIRRR